MSTELRIETDIRKSEMEEFGLIYNDPSKIDTEKFVKGFLFNVKPTTFSNPPLGYDNYFKLGDKI